MRAWTVTLMFKAHRLGVVLKTPSNKTHGQECNLRILA